MPLKNPFLTAMASTEDIQLPEYSSATTEHEHTPAVERLPPYSPDTPGLRWTVPRIAHYDFLLHTLSFILSIPTFALYAIDIGLSQQCSNSNGNSSLPSSLIVIDGLAAATTALTFFWSTIYLRLFRADAKKEALPRTWSTVMDVVLWATGLGMANTTLAMRTSQKSCGRFEDVGGCERWRRGLMIGVGVLGIVLANVVHLRWVLTCHIAGEKRRMDRRMRQAL